jgi:hypothetical protein
MKKNDKNKKPFPVARAKTLRRLGRQKGLLRDAIRSPLLAWIGKHLGLDRELAAAYAAIFAEALDHGGLADVDAVAARHGLKGNERLGFAAALDKLQQLGLLTSRGKGSRSVLLNPMVNLDTVAFVEVLHGEDSDSCVNFEDPLAVIGEAEKLINLSHDRDISRQIFFSSIARLAAKSAGRNPMRAWLKGVPPVEIVIFFMAASAASIKWDTYAYDLDDCFKLCQFPMDEKGRLLRHINGGKTLVGKRRLVKFKKSDHFDCLAFRLRRKAAEKLYSQLRQSGMNEEEGDGQVTRLKPYPKKRGELFLNPSLAKELDVLERACSQAGFSRFSRGLKKSGLPPGLTILLHGAPGTGKTVAAPISEIA